MSYKHSQNDNIIRLADGAFIPADSSNSDYQKYLAWEAAGNVAEPADAPPPISPLEQIATLERGTLMPRVVREFMLTSFAATAAGQGIDPMTSPAYVKVKALDDQIAALRRAMV